MSSTLTPNMNLIVPAVGNEAGPDYATDINSDLSILDQHDHTPGRGTKITPSALNINTALTFAGNFATNLAGLTLSVQSSTPAINTIYESGTDLYFVDGLGNNVRITQSGGIAGSPGSITNLTPPASVSYVAGSKTFIFQSGVNIAANLDGASLLLRNITPNSTNALTLQPPASLASNYSVTLPAIPADTSFMTIDTSGIIATISTTKGIVTGNIADAAITTTQLATNSVTTAKITDLNVTTAKINDLAVTYGKLAALNVVSSSSSGAFSTSSGTPTTVLSANIALSGLRPVLVGLIADGSGSNASFLLLNTSGQANTFLIRTSTTLGLNLLRNDDASNSATLPASSIWAVDFAPPAATVTYSFSVSVLAGTLQVNYVKLVVIEL